MTRLLERLKLIAETDESIFRRQLAKEDLKRFEKLSMLFKTSDDLAAFKKDGLYIGWTQSDMKTHELRDTIEPLLDAYYAHEQSDAAEASEAALNTAWDAFHSDRMEKLIHCL